MKKKCTNSKCRKTFTLWMGARSCPYCGKEYPRAFDWSRQEYDMESGFIRFKSNGTKPHIPIKKKQGKEGIWITGVSDELRTVLTIQKWLSVRHLYSMCRKVKKTPFFVGNDEIIDYYLKDHRSEYQDAPTKARKHSVKKLALEQFAKELEKVGCTGFRTEK